MRCCATTNAGGCSPTCSAGLVWPRVVQGRRARVGLGGADRSIFAQNRNCSASSARLWAKRCTMECRRASQREHAQAHACGLGRAGLSCRARVVVVAAWCATSTVCCTVLCYVATCCAVLQLRCSMLQDALRLICRLRTSSCPSCSASTTTSTSCHRSTRQPAPQP